MKTFVPFLTASVLIAGCAKTTPLVLGPDHPASVEAAAAPASPPSTTLAIDRSPTTRPSTSATSHPASHEGHAGHGQAGENTHAPQPATAPAATQPASRAVYTCAHHPNVVSDQPGNCPKCKMKLTRKEVGQ